jgi:hypothetical protein
MANGNDPLNIKKNFVGFALFVLIILVLVDVILRLSPGTLRPQERASAITAVGHHHQFEDGSSYYIYTIFEGDGDVYQCWWDQQRWNQKKVTNYRAPTLPQEGE